MSLRDTLVEALNESLLPRLRTKIEELLPKIPEKGSGQQILSMLKNNGVTDDEIRWTKIGTLLAQPKVTKDEIVNHLATHGLPFHTQDRKEMFSLRYQDYALKGGKNYGEKLFLLDRGRETVKLEWEKAPKSETYNDVEWLINGYYPGDDRSGRWNPPADPVAEIYGEIETKLGDPQLRVCARAKQEEAAFGNGTRFDFKKVFSELVTKETQEAAIERAKEACNKILTMSGPRGDGKEHFTHGHWPGAEDPLFHIRHQEFTDADGKNIWLIEEIQSDWHQSGRKKGYKADAEAKKKINPEFKMWEKDGKFFLRYDPAGDGSQPEHGPYANAEQAIKASWSGDQGKILDAPMKKSWEEMAFKWALHQAVETNADRIGWVTGQISADRYDLSKDVGEIMYKEKYGELRAYKPPRGDAKNIEGANGGLAFERSGVKPDDLEGIIGKELAKKIMDHPVDSEGRRWLRGLELKMGGEGMKAAYDQRIPSIAKKIAKATGAMMGKVRLLEAKSETVESSGPPQVDKEAMQKAARMIRDQHSGVSWDSQGTPELGDEEAQEKYESDGKKFDDLVQTLCELLETGDPNKIPEIGKTLAEMDDLESEWNDTPATDRAGEVIVRRFGWSDWSADLDSANLFHHMQQYEHKANDGKGPEVWYLELNNKVKELVAGGMRATFEAVKPKATKPWWLI